MIYHFKLVITWYEKMKADLFSRSKETTRKPHE